MLPRPICTGPPTVRSSVKAMCAWKSQYVNKGVHVQVLLAPGASVKKAAGAVKQAIQKGSLQQLGYSWADPDQYEHEVNILQRFLVDTSVSGGTAYKLISRDVTWSFCDQCL